MLYHDKIKIGIFLIFAALCNIITFQQWLSTRLLCNNARYCPYIRPTDRGVSKALENAPKPYFKPVEYDSWNIVAYGTEWQPYMVIDRGMMNFFIDKLELEEHSLYDDHLGHVEFSAPIPESHGRWAREAKNSIELRARITDEMYDALRKGRLLKDAEDRFENYQHVTLAQHITDTDVYNWDMIKSALEENKIIEENYGRLEKRTPKFNEATATLKSTLGLFNTLERLRREKEAAEEKKEIKTETGPREGLRRTELEPLLSLPLPLPQPLITPLPLPYGEGELELAT